MARKPIGADAAVTEPVDRRESLKSMHKLMGVLGCFSVYDRSLSLGEIAERCGFPKTTTYRLLRSLREAKLLEQDRERDHYRLGIRLFELGSIVLANMELRREGGPYLQALARLGDGSAELCVFDGTHMVDIGQAGVGLHDPAAPVASVRILPATCTAAGKAVLAFQDAATIDRVLLGGLVPYTPQTILDPTALRSALREVRKRGWALEDEELITGRRSIGAPIYDASGKVFAAIALHASPEKLPLGDRSAALGSFIQSTAVQISRHLGFRPSVASRPTRERRSAPSQPAVALVRRPRVASKD